MSRLPRGMKPLPKVKNVNRGKSAYFLFCDHMRAQHEKAGTVDKEIAGKSMAAASKVYSARWKALSDAERAPFVSESADIKAKNKAAKPSKTAVKEMQMVNGKAGLPDGWTAIRDATSGCLVYVNKANNRAQWHRPTEADAVRLPAKPAKAGRLFFEEQVALDTTTTVKSAAAAFLALPAEQKKVYEARAHALKTAYRAAMSHIRVGGDAEVEDL